MALRTGAKLSAGVLVAGAAAVVWAAAGDLDATFDGDGVAVRSTGGGLSPDCAVQADGKVVIGGSDRAGATYQRWSIARWNADGTPDTAFGSGGSRVLFGTLNDDRLQGVALDGSGRILAAGGVWVGVTYKGGKSGSELRATVARLLANGSPDTSFGSGGSVSIAIANTMSSEARCVLVQPDGKVLVAGRAYPKVKGNELLQTAVFVARLTASGSLDTSFGSAGVTVYDVSPKDDMVTSGALALQSDGKIVLASTQDFVVVNNVAWSEGHVCRFTASGAVDTSFGVVKSPNAPYDSFRGIAVDASNRIVVTGRRSYAINVGDVLAMRFGSNGALDTSFGSSGAAVVHVGPDSFGQRVAIAADGRIVLGGYDRPNSPTSLAGRVVTARLDSNGTLDATYGSSGTTAALAVGDDCNLWGLAIAPSGAIVGSGRTSTAGTPNTYGWWTARWLGN